MITNIKPKILYFDIETTIAVFAGFRLGKQYINQEQILKRPQVMCISWAWNDGKIQHDTFDLKKYDLLKKDDDADLGLLTRFCKVLAQADLVVGQNSANFDLPTLLSRIIKYKLPPLPEIQHDDTYLQTKKAVGHLSHKLDDVGDFLGYGRKADHGHGMEWWIAVSQGDKSILNKMVRYCDEDVIKLRKIYKHQLPYVKSKLNMSTFAGKRECCPQCSSTDLVKDGFARPGLAKYQRFRCNACGHPFRGGENLNKKTKEFTRTR